MTRSLEASGKTVEEAIDAALRQLGVPRQFAEIEVLEQPSRGLFGIFGPKMAKVRVTVKKDRTGFAREFIETVAKHLGVPVMVEVSERERAIEVHIDGEDTGLLIGRRGQTLEALQFLVNVAAGKIDGERKRIILDVSRYRQRRIQFLERLARRTAQRVRNTGRRAALEPMSAMERRVVHTALSGFKGVRTESEGEEPFRRVVIVPVDQRRDANI